MTIACSSYWIPPDCCDKRGNYGAIFWMLIEVAVRANPANQRGISPLITAGLLSKQIAAEALRLGADRQVPAHAS